MLIQAQACASAPLLIRLNLGLPVARLVWRARRSERVIGLRCNARTAIEVFLAIDDCLEQLAFL